MSNRQALIDEVVSYRQELRAFAISLSGNGDRADDLVQDTLVNAIKGIDSYQPSNKMLAWLMTILKNKFRSDYRKRKRDVEDPGGLHQDTLKTPPGQFSALQWQDFLKALKSLPRDQYDALLLIGYYGFSYDDAAAICSVSVGTIKSRVHRARQKLFELFPENDSILIAAASAEAGADASPDM